jgi:ribosome-associated protein
MNTPNQPLSSESASPDERPKTEPTGPTIHLDQFLKTCGVPTGGQAKVLIQGGEVLVNNQIETRRRRQLRNGDEVTLDDVVYLVAFGEP